jgi:hypothetical protein
LQPGEQVTVPSTAMGIWVNARTTGHRWSGVIWQDFYYFPPGYDQPPGFVPFPPSSNTVQLATIWSYLYKQYDDDDDLQAMVAAYNISTQAYVDWFANANLPIYPVLQGQLLDWIGQGLYGLARPSVPLGKTNHVGPLNTWQLNTIPLNTNRVLYPSQAGVADDDLYKRVLTWHFFKGDGKIFDVRWLKRRVMRFLVGVNGYLTQSQGGVLGPADTSDVSVTFGADDTAQISIGWTRRNLVGGALLNDFGFKLNTQTLNAYVEGPPQTSPALPYAPIFKAAMDNGVLEFPFQYAATVILNQVP